MKKILIIGFLFCCSKIYAQNYDDDCLNPRDQDLTLIFLKERNKEVFGFENLLMISISDISKEERNNICNLKKEGKSFKFRNLLIDFDGKYRLINNEIIPDWQRVKVLKNGVVELVETVYYKPKLINNVCKKERNLDGLFFYSRYDTYVDGQFGIEISNLTKKERNIFINDKNCYVGKYIGKKYLIIENEKNKVLKIRNNKIELTKDGLLQNKKAVNESSFIKINQDGTIGYVDYMAKVMDFE